MFVRVLFLGLFGLSLLATQPVRALELGSTCADLLGKLDHTVAPGVDVHLGPKQILLQGELEAFWETGMEDQTGWCIADETRLKPIFSSAYYSLFYLSKGDEVFLLNADNSLMYHGYYDQTFEKRTIDIGYGPLVVNPNRPLLFADRELTQPLLNPANFAELFHRGVKVAAVHNVDEREQSGFKQYIIPEMKAYLANQNNPDRFINLANGKKFEMGAYQYKFSGPVTYEFVEKEWNSQRQSYLQFDIQTDEGIKHLEYWDFVFILDAKGKVITHGRVDASYGLVVPDDLDKKHKFLKRLPDFSSVIVVRKKSHR